MTNPVQRQVLEAMQDQDLQLPDMVALTGKAKPTLSAILFGVIYAGLGMVGWIIGNGNELLLGLHLEIGENLVHLLLGAWALAAGIFSRY